ncbi:hypothetical protein A3H55_00770 [Candidatus Kuenenbacteria bacterium RIFCSPLOWO2_02_FULL_42_16]|uniref:Uncharacterized protein n=1 Tax=Candidatus Kuenenbacteria bacterium RIFCSPLOWO2_02_FULL_42_16 TaxID=1798564 RepID=A0A1F6FWV8_9BACT|nr:MAG: hypothetical protein A3H55_00770 [Candidatus Kuenenbacteria bacterium RIFCSPLOWO2_02_FULL_42_16]
MISPVSTEFLESRLACHTNSPCAFPASISFTILLNTGRPGAFAECASDSMALTLILLSRAIFFNSSV